MPQKAVCIVTQDGIGKMDARTPDILVAQYNIGYLSNFSLKLFILTLDTMAEWSKAVDLSLTSSVVWPLLQKCAWVRNPLVSITLFARSSCFLPIGRFFAQHNDGGADVLEMLCRASGQLFFSSCIRRAKTLVM
jgi:hypothetical protein